MVKPWLLLPSKFAHDISPFFLNLYSKFVSPKNLVWNQRNWRGLNFSNPLGIAGGVDKNAENIEAWWSFGAGFVEVGTITPLPQKPNPGTIIKRYNKQKTLWNKMGFPNKGMENAYKNLNSLQNKNHTPIFGNIGKNRQTQLSEAHQDYIKVMNKINHLVDVFVVNISSPNTANLRNLFNKAHLSEFLKPIIDHNNNQLNKKNPTLLKLSPDLTKEELVLILDTSLALDIDGWIISNTTTDRSSSPQAPIEGGVSGQPLAQASRNLLKLCSEHLLEKKGDRLLISCGGVLTPIDVYDRLKLGADMVQVYSALVFDGPLFFKKTAKSKK